MGGITTPTPRSKIRPLSVSSVRGVACLRGCQCLRYRQWMAYGDPSGSEGNHETHSFIGEEGPDVADQDDSEFAADCLAFAKGSDVPHRHGANGRRKRLEASPRIAVSEPEHDLREADPRPNPAAQADVQGIIRQLRTHIEELRTSLSESQAQNEAISATLHENEALRQALTHARGQRSADVNAIEDLERQLSAAQSELAITSQALSAMTAERGVDMADLNEARRREAHARAELATAITAISGHDSELEQLRQIITNGDLEIAELRQRLLEAEEARAVDAAAFLDALHERST